MEARGVLETATEAAKRVGRPGYFRYLSKRADWSHSPPSDRLRPREGPEHVLVVVLDALRPDYVPDLPLVFSRAITPSTWTFPAVTSLHTGQYPHEHGAVAHTMPGETEFAMPEQVSPEWTLPAAFEAAGYETLGVFGFPMAFMATRSWYGTHRVFADAPAERVVDVYDRWRRTRSRTFAYLHLGDLHAPLAPPARYVEAHDVDTSLAQLPDMLRYTETYDDSEECRYFREHRLRLYDAALEYVEDVLGPLIAELDGDDALVVLTGDHGEAHWEHHRVDRQMTDSRPNYGVGHGGTPFDMVSRVPLGVSADELLPEGGWASLVDLPRTLVGHSLEERGLFGGEDWRTPVPADRVAISEAPRYGVERKAAYRGDRKVIRSVADDVTLYATVEDGAGERFDGATDAGHERLLEALPDAWARREQAAGVESMVSDQLEALGYK